MKLLYKRVCIVDTIYSMSLFFLLSKSVKDFEDTLFVVSNGIPKQILEKLPNVIYEQNVYDFDLSSKKLLLRLKLIRLLKYNWRFIFAKHYALDHLPFSPQYLGFSRYVLLEDAPGILRRVEKDQIRLYPNEKRDFLWYVNAWFYHGGCWKNIWGQNVFCKNIIISDPKDVESGLLKNKHFTLVNLKKMWDKKKDSQKQWFMSFLGLDTRKLKQWEKAKTLILTNPWITDNILTEEEYISCYKSSIDKYKDTGVIVKPHPRDHFDWHKHFPELQVMDTIVPMQILCFLGVQFDRAVTVASTAVTSFPSETEIVWLGHKICPALLEKCGEEKWIPDNVSVL